MRELRGIGSRPRLRPASPLPHTTDPRGRVPPSLHRLAARRRRAVHDPVAFDRCVDAADGSRHVGVHVSSCSQRAGRRRCFCFSLACRSRSPRALASRADAAAPTQAGILQKRGWQIFLLAHVFRFQSFLLNPNGSWNSILKPDILNILGSRPGRGRVLLEARRCPERAAASWLLGPAVLVLALTPLSREWWWPTLLPVRFEAYIRPVGNFGVFSLFPAVAYVFAGAFVGWLVWEHRSVPSGGCIDAWRSPRSCSSRSAAPLSAIHAFEVPSPIDSSPFFAWRTGAMILALAASWALFRTTAARRPGARSSCSARPRCSSTGSTSRSATACSTYPIHHSLPLVCVVSRISWRSP